MAAKPTHEELKERVKALEKEFHQCRCTKDALRERTRRLELAYDQSEVNGLRGKSKRRPMF